MSNFRFWVGFLPGHSSFSLPASSHIYIWSGFVSFIFISWPMLIMLILKCLLSLYLQSSLMPLILLRLQRSRMRWFVVWLIHEKIRFHRSIWSRLPISCLVIGYFQLHLCVHKLFPNRHFRLTHLPISVRRLANN